MNGTENDSHEEVNRLRRMDAEGLKEWIGMPMPMEDRWRLINEGWNRCYERSIRRIVADEEGRGVCRHAQKTP